MLLVFDLSCRPQRARRARIYDEIAGAKVTALNTSERRRRFVKPSGGAARHPYPYAVPARATAVAACRYSVGARWSLSTVIEPLMSVPTSSAAVRPIRIRNRSGSSGSGASRASLIGSPACHPGEPPSATSSSQRRKRLRQEVFGRATVLSGEVRNAGDKAGETPDSSGFTWGCPMQGLFAQRLRSRRRPLSCTAPPGHRQHRYPHRPRRRRVKHPGFDAHLISCDRLASRSDPQRSP